MPLEVDAGDGVDLQLHRRTGEEVCQRMPRNQLTGRQLMEARPLHELRTGADESHLDIVGKHPPGEPLRCGKTRVAGSMSTTTRCVMPPSTRHPSGL